MCPCFQPIQGVRAARGRSTVFFTLGEFLARNVRFTGGSVGNLHLRVRHSNDAPACTNWRQLCGEEHWCRNAANRLEMSFHEVNQISGEPR